MRIQRVGARGDLGVTLVETVIAMVVVAISAALMLSLLIRTSEVTRDGNRRTVAANVLTSQIESVRSQPAISIADGLVQTTRTVGNVVYTVRQTASYLSSGAAGSVCQSSGGSLAYKLVTVTVTWPGMGTVRPVKGDTLKSVGIGNGNLNQSAKGSLAVLINGYDSTPRSGVTVTIPSLSLSQTTGDDGCVVFAGLSPGGYAVTASTSGFVGVQNAQAVTVPSLSIAAAAITRTTINDDSARSVAVSLSDGTSYQPAGMPLRVGSSFVTDTTLTACPLPVTAACMTGLPGTVQSLFPAVYTISVGACTETSPSQATVDLRGTASTTPTVILPVGTVVIDVVTTSGSSLAGRTVTVTHAPGCSETYSLPSTSSGGSRLVLPYGTWTLSTPIVPSSATKVTTSVTLSPTAPAATTTLTVNA